MDRIIIEAISGPEVIALVALMVANIVLALLAALKNGVFRLGNLADFIPKRLMPFFAYLIVVALAEFVKDYGAIAVVVYAGLVGLYSKGILAALKSLTGIQLPDIITKKND